MRVPLFWKLWGAHSLVTVGVVAYACFAIDYLGQNHLSALMGPGDGVSASVHEMFLHALHQTIRIVGVAGCLLGAGLSFVVARQIMRPISALVEATSGISSGDWSTRAEVDSSDELGDLARAFNRMAEQLENAEQRRKALITDIVHELRTPLTNIRGYLEALTDGVLTPSKSAFESLQEETMRLVKFVEGLFQLAKADAARVGLNVRPISLPELVSQTMALFRSRFDDKKIRATTVFEPGTESVTADPDKLAQIFQNLLENAVQHIQSSGEVQISAHLEPQSVKVVVANTGMPIPKDDLPFIFERFYRGKSVSSEVHAGAGIGLAIVKDLVEAHGGNVGAESSSSTTRVWFTLPRRDG